jgi:hypothetical protein
MALYPALTGERRFNSVTAKRTRKEKTSSPTESL